MDETLKSSLFVYPSVSISSINPGNTITNGVHLISYYTPHVIDTPPKHRPDVDRCPSETDFTTDPDLSESSKIKLLLQESTSMKMQICKLSIQQLKSLLCLFTVAV